MRDTEAARRGNQSPAIIPFSTLCLTASPTPPIFNLVAFGASYMVSPRLPHVGRPSRGLCAVVLAVAVCCLLGCSQGPQGTSVRGKITYSGKPLERGSVLFNPTDKTQPASRAEIQTDGSYALVAAPGDYQVIVTSLTSAPPTVAPDHPDYVRPKSAIPAKYNSLQTTPLKQTIPPTDTVIDLQL